MYRCPSCKSADHLRVLIEIWATLTQPENEPDAFSTEIVEGDHEWNANSTMMCTNSNCAESFDTHIAEYFEIDDPTESEKQ